MKRTTLLRVGGIVGRTSRFLDVLEDKRISKFVIVDFEENLGSNMEELFWTAKFFNKEHLLQKLTVIPLRLSLYKKILRRTAPRFKLSADIIKYTDIYRIKKIINTIHPDLIWVGDNDFDYSNLLFYLFHSLISGKVKFARSYKETRYVKKWDERYMLENSDKLVFPHAGYINFFERLYQNKIKFKEISFADLDWRYSLLIDRVRGIKVQKLSDIDGAPHVCILTGRALSKPTEKRSGYRYYYVPLIRELTKRGIKVHMHARRIIPDEKGVNIYGKISEETENFFIEEPIKLTIEGYKILKRYDAGILHPRIPELEATTPLREFQKLNIPNRFYDYEIAEVIPIVEKNSLPSTEKLIQSKKFGLIYEDYDDLKQKLYQLIRKDTRTKIERSSVKSFADFKEELLKGLL